MTLRPCLGLAAALLLAGCSKPAEVRFALFGHTPYTSLMPDHRSVEYNCPTCGRDVAYKSDKCGNKNCEQELTWPDKVTCRYCDGTGVCDACRKYERTEGPNKGKCPFCDEEGVTPQNTACANCNQKLMCPSCKGSVKCDMCGGSGEYTLPAGAEELPGGSRVSARDPSAPEPAAAEPPAADPPADAPPAEPPADAPPADPPK